MLNESFFTPEEVSKHLRVPLEAIEHEITAGRLRALRVAGFVRIRESDLNTYMAESVAVQTAETQSEAKGPALQLSSVPDFTYTWPGGNVEEYTEAREGLASYKGKQHHVRLGFTFRNSAGKLRRRCLILVDRYATVEFVSADEKSNGEMASIIKDRNGKQLPVGAILPSEYQDVPVRPYRDVVIGSRASNGLAVVCQDKDFDSMIQHALIRYQFRKDRQ